jgi:hypothetical protein
MFLGHFGVALAAKRAAPKTSLAVLVAAAELLDLVWPLLVLLGVERVRNGSSRSDAGAAKDQTPGWMFSFIDPTAETDTSRSTPSDFMAKTLAR